MTEVRRRWWLLGSALVVAAVIGFGLGLAVKSTSSPAAAGSLASGSSSAVSHVTVKRLGAVVAVPPLKPRATHKTTSTSSSASATTASATASAPSVTATSNPLPTTQTFAAPHTPTVAAPSSGGGGGGGSGGGGGGGGAGGGGGGAG
ncbi:MAG: hypothetical protein ACJ780_32165 [Solirubrobacteraceae bacterium]